MTKKKLVHNKQKMQTRSKRKTNKDYNSKDGFWTRTWGPVVWHFLTMISLNYPVDPTPTERTHYEQFILSLGNVLPCRTCRENYTKNLTSAGFFNKTKDVLKSRHSLSRFIYRLQTEVHKMTTKEKKLPISFNMTRENYECLRAKCAKTKGKEQGCILPKEYVPSRILLHIVPLKNATSVPSFQIDNECFTKKIKKPYLK